MGVEFGEVAGVMSALTLSGVSTDEAATQINALLTSLQKLPKHAQESMKAMTGLDYATVQQDLRTKGLTQTLKTIYNAFGDNEDAIAQVFGNVRALRGITGLFGEKEEQTLRVVQATTHALGAQDQALQDTQASASYALRQSQAQFDNAMTSIGASVTPIIAGLTSFAAGVISLTGLFGSAGQSVVVFVGVVAAAAGPLLYMGSSVMRLVGNLATLADKLMIAERFRTLADAQNGFGAALRAIIPQLARFRTAITMTAVGAAAAIIIYQSLSNAVHALDDEYKKLGEEGKQKTTTSDTFADLTKRVDVANKGLADTNAEIDSLHEQSDRGVFQNLNLGLARSYVDAQNAGNAYQEMGKDAQAAVEQVEAISRQFDLNKDVATQWVMGQRAIGVTFKSTEEALKAYKEALDRGDASTKKATDDNEKAKNSWEGLMAAVKASADTFFGVVSAQENYNNALEKIEDAKDGVTKAEKAHRDAIDDVADAQKAELKANQAIVASTRKVEDAKLAAADAQKALSDALAGPSAEEKLDLRSARLAVREAQAAMKGGSGQTSLDRERNAISLARAQADLKRAQGAHDKRVADLRKDVADATEAVTDAEQARQDAIDAAAKARQATLDAQAKERDTLREIRTAEDEVTKARMDAVGPAMALSDAQGKLVIGLQTGTIEADKFKKYLTDLKELYPELAGELQGYLDKFGLWELAHPKTVPAPEPFANNAVIPDEATRTAWRDRLLRGAKPNATGGLLGAGQLATVNERGTPELWTEGGRQYLLPVGAGRVTPLSPMDINVKGGDGVSVGDIYVQGAESPVQTAYEVRRQLRVATRTKGRA